MKSDVDREKDLTPPPPDTNTRASKWPLSWIFWLISVVYRCNFFPFLNTIFPGAAKIPSEQRCLNSTCFKMPQKITPLIWVSDKKKIIFDIVCNAKHYIYIYFFNMHRDFIWCSRCLLLEVSSISIKTCLFLKFRW